MSIALDFALFMRNSSTKLGLSLANEAVGFKLAFRIGSNSLSWVSQENLLIECGLDKLDSLSNHLKKLTGAGVFLSEVNKKDKRKNIYGFSKYLINYHQKSDSEKRKVHELFNDTMIEAVDKSENTPQKQGVLNQITPRKRGVKNGDTPRKRGVIANEKTFESPATQGFQPIEKLPKETLKQRNIDNQKNRASSGSVCLKTYPDDFLPNEESNESLARHATRTNCSFRELLEKFATVSRIYKTRSTDWQQTFRQFLENERPKKTYEDEQGRKRRYDNKPINY